MENPYEAPATQQQARETLRSLWSRRLQCPHCQQPGVSVGRAFWAHPFFRVRCDHCRKPSRVKMSATALKREVTILFVLAILGIVVISWFLLLDPFDGVHKYLERWLPGFRGANFTVFGTDGRKCIVATVVGLITIPPFLLLGVIVTRRGLEHVAFHSHLIPLHLHLSSRSGE